MVTEDLADIEAQENLGIRYESVLNPVPLTEIETKLLAEMTRQAKNWGDTPLTPAIVQNLGNWSDDDIVRAKRKRVSADDDLAISNLAPLPNPNASMTSHRTYHAPSPPPLEDLLPSPLSADTVSYVYPSALDITYPQPQVQRQQPPEMEVSGQNIIQQPPEGENSIYLGEFTSSFDLAFAKWLDEENISKAAIGRLLKDPSMQPITSKLSWKSVSKMKDRLESIGFHEDSE